ncbi:phosphoglycerate kinase [Streptomyces sp. NPDC026294]|uniref:phosphoglycerate kinase n=1 Tax=Streptomyces sp. NPDC026294 TaxID=3155362 RepID=UPI0033E07C71
MAYPLLRQTHIQPGDRWVYSAGFNVGKSLGETSRIDSELDDIAYASQRGAVVALLSHQGSYRDGSAVPLPHIAEYLTRRLGAKVEYFSDAASDEARRHSLAMSPGDITLFGNTRLYEGEEKNDPDLARRFAALGNRVALGGFSKAHRAHASNVGILAHLPGVLAGSLVSEAEKLDTWSGRQDTTYSVAVLGGVKPEKTLIGLEHFTRIYDVVIPAGAVLNNILAALGHPVGASCLGERADVTKAAAARIVARANRAEISVPEQVVIARPGPAGNTDHRTASVRDGIPDGYAIVDIVLPDRVFGILEHLVRSKGSALLAGTPSVYTAGHTQAADHLLAAFSAPGVNAMLLGGDTVGELPFQGRTSTGGGSALHYLATGSFPVLTALAQQQARTNP